MLAAGGTVWEAHCTPVALITSAEAQGMNVTAASPRPRKSTRPVPYSLHTSMAKNIRLTPKAQCKMREAFSDLHRTQHMQIFSSPTAQRKSIPPPFSSPSPTVAGRAQLPSSPLRRQHNCSSTAGDSASFSPSPPPHLPAGSERRHHGPWVPHQWWAMAGPRMALPELLSALAVAAGVGAGSPPSCGARRRWYWRLPPLPSPRLSRRRRRRLYPNPAVVLLRVPVTSSARRRSRAALLA